MQRLAGAWGVLVDDVQERPGSSCSRSGGATRTSRPRRACL